MVHHVPDANGHMHFNRDANRCGYFIANLDEDETLTVNVEGNPTFTLVPQSYIKISDSVGIDTEMTNNSRNYTVLEYSAGSEF
jgi:hypothetical protein